MRCSFNDTGKVEYLNFGAFVLQHSWNTVVDRCLRGAWLFNVSGKKDSHTHTHTKHSIRILRLGGRKMAQQAGFADRRKTNERDASISIARDTKAFTSTKTSTAGLFQKEFGTKSGLFGLERVAKKNI